MCVIEMNLFRVIIKEQRGRVILSRKGPGVKVHPYLCFDSAFISRPLTGRKIPSPARVLRSKLNMIKTVCDWH